MFSLPSFSSFFFLNATDCRYVHMLEHIKPTVSAAPSSSFRWLRRHHQTFVVIGASRLVVKLSRVRCANAARGSAAVAAAAAARLPSGPHSLRRVPHRRRRRRHHLHRWHSSQRQSAAAE